MEQEQTTKPAKTSKLAQPRTLVPKRGPDGRLTIGYDFGGETPKELLGEYTSFVQAQVAIQRYLNTRG